MKNRRFPYGYEMKNGVIVICSTEESTVKSIFDKYINGTNLKDIADSLTKREIEYFNGNCTWNKSRIKRIIEDVRYIGNDVYPMIISKEIYDNANKIKSDRRTYTEPTVTAESKEIAAKVICGECGGKLTHRTDNTQKHGERWYCKNETCKYGIPLSINELKAKITEILNLLTEKPMPQFFITNCHNVVPFSWFKSEYKYALYIIAQFSKITTLIPDISNFFLVSQTNSHINKAKALGNSVRYHNYSKLLVDMSLRQL